MSKTVPKQQEIVPSSSKTVELLQDDLRRFRAISNKLKISPNSSKHFSDLQNSVKIVESVLKIFK